MVVTIQGIIRGLYVLFRDLNGEGSVGGGQPSRQSPARLAGHTAGGRRQCWNVGDVAPRLAFRLPKPHAYGLKGVQREESQSRSDVSYGHVGNVPHSIRSPAGASPQCCERDCGPAVAHWEGFGALGLVAAAWSLAIEVWAPDFLLRAVFWRGVCFWSCATVWELGG